MEFDITTKDVYDKLISELRNSPILQQRIEIYSIMVKLLKAMALKHIGDNLQNIG